MQFPGLPSAQAPSLLHDLREGWQDFTSRRWLWIMVAQFAVSAATINVLGPRVAHCHLGGARSWGFIVAAYSTGAAAGGMVVIKLRPAGTWWPPRCPCSVLPAATRAR